MLVASTLLTHTRRSAAAAAPCVVKGGARAPAGRAYTSALTPARDTHLLLAPRAAALHTSSACAVTDARPSGAAAGEVKLALEPITEPLAPVVPLTQEWPGVPKLHPLTGMPPPRVQITTLANGLRVASQETFEQVTSAALFVDAGSMYEQPDERGVSHFIETCTFAASQRRSAAEIQALSQDSGVQLSTTFNREVIMHRVESLRPSFKPALHLLADCVLQPVFDDETVEEARRTISYQRAEAQSQPQLMVTEHLHAAAYGLDSAFGRPEGCPDTQVDRITGAHMHAYMGRHYAPDRMVLAVVGASHEEAVAVAKEAFGSWQRTPAHTSNALRPYSPYVGGDVRSSPDWASHPPTQAAATAKTEFTHFMLAFPTVGWSDDDVVPVCVVDTLCGGGSSFSAGGPGKGMYSRLYREVLNQCAWVEATNAFSYQLYSTGLVGMYGVAPPEYADSLLELLCGHLLRLAHSPPTPVELARARNQLASSVMMHLESRGVLCEDVGRQILHHGKRLDPAELLRRIQAVTADDLMRVMRKALQSPPAFAAVGDVRALPSYDTIRAALRQ